MADSDSDNSVVTAFKGEHPKRERPRAVEPLLPLPPSSEDEDRELGDTNSDSAEHTLDSTIESIIENESPCDSEWSDIPLNDSTVDPDSDKETHTCDDQSDITEEIIRDDHQLVGPSRLKPLRLGSLPSSFSRKPRDILDFPSNLNSSSPVFDSSDLGSIWDEWNTYKRNLFHPKPEDNFGHRRRLFNLSLSDVLKQLADNREQQLSLLDELTTRLKDAVKKGAFNALVHSKEQEIAMRILSELEELNTEFQKVYDVDIREDYALALSEQILQCLYIGIGLLFMYGICFDLIPVVFSNLYTIVAIPFTGNKDHPTTVTRYLNESTVTTTKTTTEVLPIVTLVDTTTIFKNLKHFSRMCRQTTEKVQGELGLSTRPAIDCPEMEAFLAIHYGTASETYFYRPKETPLQLPPPTLTLTSTETVAVSVYVTNRYTDYITLPVETMLTTTWDTTTYTETTTKFRVVPTTVVSTVVSTTTSVVTHPFAVSIVELLPKGSTSLLLPFNMNSVKGVLFAALFFITTYI